GDRYELRHPEIGELLFQPTTRPGKAEERLTYLGREFGVNVVGEAECRRGKGFRFVHGDDLILAYGTVRHHPVHDLVRDCGCVVVLVSNAKDRILVSAGEDRNVVPPGFKPKLATQQHRGSLETGVRCWGCESELATLQVGGLPDSAARVGDDLHLIPQDTS